MGSLNNIIWFIIASIVVYAACQTITQTAAEWSHYQRPAPTVAVP